VWCSCVARVVGVVYYVWVLCKGGRDGGAAVTHRCVGMVLLALFESQTDVVSGVHARAGAGGQDRIYGGAAGTPCRVSWEQQ
jgi:hypothetical protein